MPPTPKPVVPHSMCPFMSGPVVVNGVIHLFRASCAGLACRIFVEDTQDCRFNDADYDDGSDGLDEGDAQEPEVTEGEEPGETPEQ